ncbi:MULTISPECIES: anti-sigma factor [Actinoplanes]|uniref:anti-sigma factor n=1 Tax=Actinoplanes TaxID=1865 RepID=UPI0005F28E3B|nr:MULTISPECIES: anti-sigma factor [Actinoplanes]GLY03863.1 hypothetical protein Acsp01_42420 [Actinoplanes sp. NBRC 101535]
MNPDVHTLVGPYVLDALDDVERAAFTRHLRECEPCRIEADELREAAGRLADGAWSVPPPRLKATVLAAITETRQLPPPGAPPLRSAAARTTRFRLITAAAVVVAAAGAGTAVHVLQNQRVRDAQSAAAAAQASEARVRAVLTAPDLSVREQPLASGGRVTVAGSALLGAGVIMLAADASPGTDRVYQLWTIRDGTPSSAGALAAGQSTIVQVVEGLPTASEVGVTIEPAPGSAAPTTPLDALVRIS